MLIRVFYVSEVADFVTDIDVKIILGVAQMNNRRRDVTGMLTKSDVHFAQLLEGRVDEVRALTAKIYRDKRHRAVRCLLEESIVVRQFARWSMGFIQRDDMADEMRALHENGCANKLEARKVIQHLMLREP